MIKSCFNILSLSILGLVFSFQAMGQNSTQSKKAAKAFSIGENAYRMQEYQKAETNLLLAIENDPEYFDAWLILAELYEQTKRDSSAIFSYQKALSIDSLAYPSAWFYLGELEFQNGLYTESKKHLLNYTDKTRGSVENKAKAKQHVLSCDFAIEAMNNPVPFKPMNLGNLVNTRENEYFPCITADNQTLLFTRLINDKNSFTGRQEDFFTSQKSEEGWSLAKSIGPPINTNYNEGAPTLSADGNVLLFTACESVNGYGINRKGYGRCDLFISNRSGDQWTEPENVGGPVSSRYWESQPSLAADGRTLYFVSNRNKNYDIYKSTLNDQGVWSSPEILNENINTKGYEGSVFIHPDNQTLYFSSDGHLGMGGMDIFVSRKDSTGDWGKPKNLGYPINTWKDDNSIVINAQGDLAMFASDRPEGFGGLDLYAFELYPEARPQFVTYLKGLVYDVESGIKLKAAFELTNLATGETAVQSFSNEGSGEFLVCLPSNNDYALTVSKDGYLFYSENFNLEGVHSAIEPFIKDIPMKPVKVGETVVMKNIFFETDQYKLLASSKFELQKLMEFLNSNPELKIEIAGHTDNIGSPAYNLELSKNRAKAVNDFLVEKAVDQARLKYIGYGETHPIDSNDTESGRANNRRTEFKISEW